MQEAINVVVNIVLIIAPYWYDPEQPFTNQAEIYRLVCKVNRDLMAMTQDTYERAIIERDATKRLCEHYKV